MANKKVFENGLGYGILEQKSAQIVADYTKLDIAEGPVQMMKHRLKMQKLPGKVVQGSMLACPMKSEGFDLLYL